METTLGDLLPSLSAASAHQFALSGREDSQQYHSSLTDTDEEFSSAVAGKGTLEKKLVD